MLPMQTLNSLTPDLYYPLLPSITLYKLQIYSPQLHKDIHSFVAAAGSTPLQMESYGLRIGIDFGTSFLVGKSKEEINSCLSTLVTQFEKHSSSSLLLPLDPSVITVATNCFTVHQARQISEWAQQRYYYYSLMKHKAQTHQNPNSKLIPKPNTNPNPKRGPSLNLSTLSNS